MMAETAQRGYLAAVTAARAANRSNLCIGLDPDPARLPQRFVGAEGLVGFCRGIVEATSDLVCAYKPNLAFFERFGADGWRALEQIVRDIPAGIPVIADAKRGDIGNTSGAYAAAIYEHLGASASTVSPYLGLEAVAPLLEHRDGFGYVLCRTSSPGSGAIQDLIVDGQPLFAHVIRLFQPSILAGKAGLVIGAQEAQAFMWAARLVPDASLLVPGIGAQGGTVTDLARSLTPRQASLVVVNVSRAIIHAGDGQSFATAARERALAIRGELQNALSTVGRGDHGSTAG